MPDKFVELAKSSEIDFEKYLEKLDKYLQDRYETDLRNESILTKIKKNFGNSWTFTKLFEKALSESKKNKTSPTLEFIYIMDNKKINDEWVNDKQIKEALNKIKERAKSQAQYYEHQFTLLKKKQMAIKLLYEKEREDLKKSGNEKNKDGQTLIQIENNINKASLILEKMNEIAKKFDFKDEFVDVEEMKNKIDSLMSK